MTAKTPMPYTREGAGSSRCGASATTVAASEVTNELMSGSLTPVVQGRT